MKQSITWKLQIDTSKNQTIKMSLRLRNIKKKQNISISFAGSYNNLGNSTT